MWTCDYLQCSGPGSSASALLIPWAGQFLGCGGLHCEMLNTIPVLYPLDASGTPSPAVTPNRVSRHCQMSAADTVTFG